MYNLPTPDEKITITVNEDKYYYPKYRCIQCFTFLKDYFEQYPNTGEVDLTSPIVTSHGLKLLLTFLDTFTGPTTKQNWIELIQAAEYLFLNPKYNKVIIMEITETILPKFKGEKDIHLRDILKELKGPIKYPGGTVIKSPLRYIAGSVGAKGPRGRKGPIGTKGR